MLIDAEYVRQNIVDQREEGNREDAYGNVRPTQDVLNHILRNSYFIEDMQFMTDEMEESGYTLNYPVIAHVSLPSQIRDFILLKDTERYRSARQPLGSDYIALRFTKDGDSVTPAIGGISPYGNVFDFQRQGQIPIPLGYIVKAQRDTWENIEKKGERIFQHYPGEVKMLAWREADTETSFANYGGYETVYIKHTPEEVAKMIAAARLSDQQIRVAAKWEAEHENNCFAQDALPVCEIIRLAKEDNLGMYDKIADHILAMADKEDCYDIEHEMLECGQDRQAACVEDAIFKYDPEDEKSNLYQFWSKEASRRPGEGRARAVDRAASTVYYMAVGIGHERSTLENLRKSDPSETLTRFANDPVFYDPNRILREIADHGTIDDLRKLLNNPKGYPGTEDISVIYEELKAANPGDIHILWENDMVSPKDLVAIGHAINRSTVMTEKEKEQLKHGFYREIIKGSKDITRHLFIKPRTQDMLYRLRDDRQAAEGLLHSRPEDLGRELRFHVMRQELEHMDMPVSGFTMAQIRYNEAFLQCHLSTSSFNNSEHYTTLYGSHTGEIQQIAQNLSDRQFLAHMELLQKHFQEVMLPELVAEAINQGLDEGQVKEAIRSRLYDPYFEYSLYDTELHGQNKEDMVRTLQQDMCNHVMAKAYWRLLEDAKEEIRLPEVKAADLSITESFRTYGGDGPGSFDNRGGEHNYQVNGFTVYREKGFTNSDPYDSKWARDAFTDFSTTTTLDSFKEFAERHAPALAYMAKNKERIEGESHMYGIGGRMPGLKARVTQIERIAEITKERDEISPHKRSDPYKDALEI